MTQVSIIVTTHNRTRWLFDSINSLILQTYSNFEIIVVDDGSTINISNHISNNYESIKYIYQKNSGLGAARNTGIKSSKGEFIQFLDDDDWLTPDSIEYKLRQIEILSSNYLVYSDLYLTNEEGTVTSTCFSKMARPLPQGSIFVHLVEKNFIPVHSILWRRSILEEIGGFPEQSGHEDWSLLLSVSQKYLFFPIDKPLGYYRQHNLGMSHDYQKMMAGKLHFQRQIVESKHFSLLPISTQKDLLGKYTIQQYAYGSIEIAEQFQKLLTRISNKYDFKPQVVSFLLKLPKKFLQGLLKLYSDLKIVKN